jgi:hypothetical protein
MDYKRPEKEETICIQHDKTRLHTSILTGEMFPEFR